MPNDHPEHRLGDPTPREDVPRRAGTHLDHRFTKAIFGTGRNGRRSQHGVLDTRQRVYQCGGEAKNFIYANKNWVSMDEAIYREVAPQAAYLEFVDNDENVVYRISTKAAARCVNYYTAGIGLRVGFPVDQFIIYDADGLPVRRIEE